MAEHSQIPDFCSYKGDESEVIVVMVPAPGQGHLNQLLHLSRIILSHHLPVHFVSTPTHNRQAKLRAYDWVPPTNSNLHFHDIPISFDVPPPDPNAPTKFPSHIVPLFSSLSNLCEPLYHLLHELTKTSRRVVVIIDYIIFWVMQHFPSIPKVESYNFHSISAISLYYMDRIIAGKPFLINGEPVKDLPPEETVFEKPTWEFFRWQHHSTSCNQGNLYNSCRAIEGQFLDLLAGEKLTNTDRHWAIGPFNPVSILERKTPNKYMEWLDKQPPKSVIYISFGTVVSLSDEEVKEIALGLERSGQNFMWILRDADRADIFVGESRKFQLPEGFEERVEGRGIIIQDWAPQLEILGHPSTGGFMSHCGWNSSMESISMGIPIAAWPMHSDQPLNAFLISEVLRIGFMVRKPAVPYEIVKSETVEAAVKRLMASAEGAEMSKRAAELSTAVKASVKEDGATTRVIASFITHITR